MLSVSRKQWSASECATMTTSILEICENWDYIRCVKDDARECIDRLSGIQGGSGGSKKEMAGISEGGI